MKKEYELLDIKYIGDGTVFFGEDTVFLVKENGMFIVSDNENAHFPYKNFEVVILEKENVRHLVIDKKLEYNHYYNLDSAKEYFKGRCDYLEKKFLEEKTRLKK